MARIALRCSLVACLLLTALSGCADQVPRGPVRGRVTLGAEPVSGGTILFENKTTGVSAMSPLREDGSFEINTHEGRGLPVGKYQVAVTPGGMMLSSDEVPLAGKNPPPPKKPPASKIPAKYHTTAKSPLTADVREGEKSPPFEFDLSGGK